MAAAQAKKREGGPSASARRTSRASSAAQVPLHLEARELGVADAQRLEHRPVLGRHARACPRASTCAARRRRTTADAIVCQNGATERLEVRVVGEPHERAVEGDVDLDRERGRVSSTARAPRRSRRAGRASSRLRCARRAASRTAPTSNTSRASMTSVTLCAPSAEMCASATAVAPTTNVPLPIRASTRPCAASTPTACRTVGRLTPNSAASARSAGSRSPGREAPAQDEHEQLVRDELVRPARQRQRAQRRVRQSGLPVHRRAHGSTVSTPSTNSPIRATTCSAASTVTRCPAPGAISVVVSAISAAKSTE